MEKCTFLIKKITVGIKECTFGIKICTFGFIINKKHIFGIKNCTKETQYCHFWNPNFPFRKADIDTLRIKIHIFLVHILRKKSKFNEIGVHSLTYKIQTNQYSIVLDEIHIILNHKFMMTLD